MGLGVAGQEHGDVAVLAAVADSGLAEAGPAACDVGGDPPGDGVPGLLAGCLRHAFHDGRRSGRALVPLVKRIPLMLPDAALPVPASLMTLLAAFSPLFTAPWFPHVHDAGLRFPRPVREADGLRDADRGGPVAAVAARPGAPFLLPRPLEPR